MSAPGPSTPPLTVRRPRAPSPAREPHQSSSQDGVDEDDPALGDWVLRGAPREPSLTEFDHFAEAVNLVIKTKTPTLLLNLAETVERLERRVDKLEERNGKLERQNAGLKEQIKQEKESRKRGMSFDLQEDGSMGASLSKQVAELEHRMATIESTVFAKTTSHAGMDSDEKDDLEEEEVGNEAGELDDALAEDDEEAGAEVEGEARGSEQAEDDDESLLDDPLAEDDFDDYIHDSIEAARGTEAATPKRIEQQQADELAPNSLTSNALTEQGLLTSKAGPSLPLEPANGKGKQKVDGPNAATPGQPTEHPPPADPDRSSVRTVEQIREEHDYDKVDWVAYSRSVSHASNSPSDTVSGNNAIRYRALQVLYLGDDKATEAALKLLNRNNGPYYTRMRRISKSWTIANNGKTSEYIPARLVPEFLAHMSQSDLLKPLWNLGTRPLEKREPQFKKGLPPPSFSQPTPGKRKADASDLGLERNKRQISASQEPAAPTERRQAHLASRSRSRASASAEPSSSSRMLRQREPKDYSLTRYYSNMGEAFDDVLDTGPSGGTIEKSKTTPSAPATAIGFDDDASSDLKLILDSQI